MFAYPRKRVLALAACFIAAGALQVQTRKASIDVWNGPVAQVQPPAPKRREVPRLIAIDKRIARRVNALRPCVKQRLVRVLDRLPRRVTLLVTSARRTRAEQAALHSTFGVKAKPGMSTHEDGRAIDVNVLVDGRRISPRRNNKIIGAAMASEGFRYLGAMDPVHYSLPKEEVDPTIKHGPLLEVMTMAEAQELQAQLEEPAPLPADLPSVALVTAAATQ